ncbi:hypothetical protein [Aeromonas media]|uniref:hypothetical protein n=1 Tax=Aeromonas media TaxID=651 RepID=UPI003D1C1D6B
MMYDTPHTVEIRKRDGSSSGKFAALVQDGTRTTVRFNAIEFSIDVGDVVIQHTKNGGEKEYLILDTGWHRDSGLNFPERYTLKVRPSR